MAKVNVVNEILERHSDPEITEYLFRIMTGVVKNYKAALDRGDASILWANLGDLERVASMLQAVYRRDQDRLAQTLEQ